MLCLHPGSLSGAQAIAEYELQFQGVKVPAYTRQLGFRYKVAFVKNTIVAAGRLAWRNFTLALRIL